MSLTKEHVLEALRSVQDPGLHRDLVSLDAVQKVSVCDGHVAVQVSPPSQGEGVFRALRGEIHNAVLAKAKEAGGQVAGFVVEFLDSSGKVVSRGGDPRQDKQDDAKRQDTPQAKASPMPGVKRTIAVGAGKGGVGKSTVSLNLAVALARMGHSVGLLDGDIYGPSVPTLMGLDAMQATTHGGRIQPFYVHGVKTMTIGKLVEPEKPLIWRGPMAHGAFKQICEQTSWGELDYLIIDLPPGTGDVVLTMSQILQLTGGVIVCTPQKVAQDDAIRAARMFQQLGVDVLGIVENMSYFIGDDGKEYDIFGRGGAERMAQRLGIPFLGAVPIHMSLRENSDKGDPTANFEGNETLASELTALAGQLENQANLTSMRRDQERPTLSIS